MSKKDKPVTVADLAGALSKRAPNDFAESWDNVGLLAGDATEKVSGIVVSVNLGPEALEAARKSKANVVVCHHPPIFKPVSKLTRQSSPYLYEAIKEGISVIAMHTNFDLASEQMNRKLADDLGLKYEGMLASRGGEEPRSNRLGKLVTFVPVKDLEKVRKAVCDAGAGQIRNYSDCSFATEGEGTFLGQQGANPTIGKVGKLERVKEGRLEVIFPWKIMDKVVAAAKRAHPYEEMAYDVYSLENPIKSIGYGFVGRGNLTFHKLVQSVKDTFHLKNVDIAGPASDDPKLTVKKVAFSPGSGSGFVGSAAAKGIDAYICGEVGYHQILEARSKGVSLIILGHSYSERFFVETVSDWCETDFSIKSQKVFEKIHVTI